MADHDLERCRCWATAEDPPSRPAEPWACRCPCSRCAWEREVAVKLTMSFREKHEELTLLGAQYKSFFMEGYAAKLAAIAPINVKGTHDLLLERARRITVSMTAAERELAGMLSPQPRASFIVPGTRPFRPKGEMS